MRPLKKKIIGIAIGIWQGFSPHGVAPFVLLALIALSLVFAVTSVGRLREQPASFPTTVSLVVDECCRPII
jgi:hypothetical protein